MIAACGPEGHPHTLHQGPLIGRTVWKIRVKGPRLGRMAWNIPVKGLRLVARHGIFPLRDPIVDDDLKIVRILYVRDPIN